ncbi:hypothetical protein RE476_01655 [Methanolobus mangrovi]|uniref:Uncharacterized protein n=1 Tax=Methanolobus mangrovi TaxID=3072977 RepID=A0AA51YJV6_9EURY|nr:hypothetical protein [Methanolobus mangrovi]WMW22549.1 hypothetical protein RE476_01655 [Methanolobus mangrovi]
MKRLTISMSDELFDKLDVIENKSLFIRKLIERELDMLDNVPTDNIIPWTERFAILRDDVNIVLNRLEMIEKNIPGINEVLENVENESDMIYAHKTEDKNITLDDELLFESQTIEEFAHIGTNDIFKEADAIAQVNLKPVLQETVEQIEPPLPDNEEVKQELAEPVQETMINSTEEAEFEPENKIQQSFEESIHEMKLSEIVAEKRSESELEMAQPEIENATPIILKQTNQDSGFVMPELKPPEQTNQDSAFVMPEFKSPEQTNQDSGFVMPELKPPEQANQDSEFVMPELKPQEQTNQDSGFVMPELKPPEQTNQDSGFVMPELKPPEQTNQDSGVVMPELKPPEQANQDSGFVMPELKPQEQTNQDSGFVMPEFKPPEQTNQDIGFVMPELKPPEQTNQDSGFVMPEFKPPEQTNQNSGFVMPELKPQEQTNQDLGFVMPELKPPEQTNQDSGFVMPEFKPPEQTNQNSGFVMPELKPPEQTNQDLGFVMPELKPPEHTPVVPDFKPPEGMPTFELSDMVQPANFEGMPEVHNIPPQPTPFTPAPMIEQSDDTKLDKLEGNILMYMPRGAKVKKEIIKSLVSRHYSQEDIDRKIQELVAREVLVLKQENGIEQLHRLK